MISLYSLTIHQYVPLQVGLWLPLSAILGGTVAVFLGGSLADRLASKRGAKARLAVLGSALVLSSPMAAGTLLLDPPLAFVSLLGYYLLGSLPKPFQSLPQLRRGLASSLSPWLKLLLRV